MFGKLIPKLIFAGALLASAAAWAADPTVDQVYDAAKAGNYSQAQSMMDQVLRDHPNSAKAHFIEAELLARQGKLASARSEFATAQKLDSSLSFAKPGAVQELKSLLASGGNGSGAGRMAGGVHVAWGPLLAILAVIVVILMIVRSRAQRVVVEPGPGGWRPAQGPMPGGPVMPGGYPGGATMMPPAAGGMGSGIMGGLATGAAVGAGMVAGEALMHRVLGDGSQRQVTPLDNNDYVQDNSAGNYDMGGNDFGVNDTGSWDDDSSSGGGWGDSGGGSDDNWN